MWGEIYGEKPFEWRETLLMERKLSIGEKPFDWRETFQLVPVEVFVLLALWRVLKSHEHRLHSSLQNDQISSYRQK